MNFDITVIGGGPGGYVAAIRAAQLGKKVALVEKSALGGICLNWGCIPTKTLLKSAGLLQEFREKGKTFGIKATGVEVDYPQVMENSRKVADRLSKGVAFLMKKNNIQVFPARGRLLDKNTIALEKEDGSSEKIQSEFIILATGARPRVLSHLQPDGERIWTSKEALSKKELPPSIAIIGAGAIGVEFAYFFNAMGSRVTLIEMVSRIVPQEDAEISEGLEKSFKKQGIKVLTNTIIETIEKREDLLSLTLKQGMETKTLEVHTALLAIGVQGNIENLGLEDLGIETERNHIKVNEFCQTSLSNIYGIGDVIGPPWLAHVASKEGLLAVEHLCGKEVEPLDYTSVPGCTYCHPQVASVGYTEQKALEAGYQVKVGRFPLRALGKALAMGEKEGFIKIILDEKYGEVLGCHILASEATELISEITLARMGELTYLEILKTIHPHPTLSEAILEATHEALGEGIHI